MDYLFGIYNNDFYYNHCIESEKMKLYCPRCNLVYDTVMGDYKCPRCGTEMEKEPRHRYYGNIVVSTA